MTLNKLHAKVQDEKRCARCGGTFMPHHWVISHRDEHYHTGCVEKTPARVTQLIQATREDAIQAERAKMRKELEKRGITFLSNTKETANETTV